MVHASSAMAVAAAAAAGSVTKFYPYDERKGLPELNVLYTSDQGQALNFLNNRMNTSVVALDMQWRPFVVTKSKGKHEYSRSTVLRMAAAEWVLIFDLLPEPWLNRPPRPLSDKFCNYLTAPNRTFYGTGLVTDASRLAFELNCVLRQGVDMRNKPWTHADFSTGLVDLGNKILHTTVPMFKRVTLSDWEWRPLTWPQMHHMVEHIYLAWAVADHYLKVDGPAKPRSYTSKVQMYRVGVRLRRQGMTVRKTRYDWSRVAEEVRTRRERLRKQGQTKLHRIEDDEDEVEEDEHDEHEAAEMEGETKRHRTNDDYDTDDDSDDSDAEDDTSLEGDLDSYATDEEDEFDSEDED